MREFLLETSQTCGGTTCWTRRLSVEALCGLALAAQLTRARQGLRTVRSATTLGRAHPDNRLQIVGPCDRSRRILVLAGSAALDDRVAVRAWASRASRNSTTARALRLSEADDKPEKIEVAGGVHGGARRIAGGAQKDHRGAAARNSPETQGCIRIGPDSGLRDGERSCRVDNQQGGSTRVVEARRVVIALPPRLAEERIAFRRRSTKRQGQTMRDAPTWMAAQAKAVTTFASPAWRAGRRIGQRLRDA